MRVNIHPFIAHVPILNGALKSSKVSAAVERALTARLDFVRDSASAVAASSAAQRTPRNGTKGVVTRQYVHRGGAAFVRADDGGGLLWIRNRLRRETGPAAELLKSLRAHAAVLRALVSVVDSIGLPEEKTPSIVDRVADYLVAAPDEDAPVPSSRLASDTPMRRPDSPGVLERVASMQTPAKDSRPPTPVPPSAGGSPLGGSSSGRKPSSPVGIGASGRKLDLL